MSALIRCSIFRDTRDRLGVPVAVTWDALCARLARHEEGAKDGPAMACAVFRPGQPRGNASVVARTLVALDIESNKTTGEVPPSFDATLAYLAAKRVRAALWTTHSHTPAMPRYRVLMPLARPLDYDPAVDPWLAAAASAQLRLFGVSDPSKFGAASLFFLPRHPAAAEYSFAKIAGDPIESGMLLTSAMTIAQGVAQDEAEVLARRQARELPPETRALIDGYNAAHPIAGQFVRYGYRRDGGRWKSRYQHAASQGATSITNDTTWSSFSESDALAGVGNRPMRRASQSACFGDSFSLFVHYEHAGSFRAAVESLKGAAS